MENNQTNLKENIEPLGSDLGLKEQREKLEKTRGKLKKMEHEFKKQERKKRDHHLISIGGLAAKALIAHFDKNLLLGAFMFIAEEIKDNPLKVQEWTETGFNIFLSDLEKKAAAKQQEAACGR